MVKIKSCRRGTFAYDPEDIVQGRSLDLYSEYSEAEVWAMSLMLRPGDVVVDVGAGIGCHVVAMGGMVGPTGTIHAFEPERHSFHRLCANVTLNNLRNVYCHRSAVGSADGTGLISEVDCSVRGNFGNRRLGTGDPVPVKTVDSLNLPSLKLLKIDTNGSEFDVIDGSKDTIKRCNPYIYMQCERDKFAEAEHRLSGLGYTVFHHTCPMYSVSNAGGNFTNVFRIGDKDIASYLLCGVPEGRECPFPQQPPQKNSKMSIPSNSKGTTSCSLEARKRNKDFDRYLHGRGIDIGGGYDTLVVENGTVDIWDVQQGDATHMRGAATDYDFVYSSHCLEHILEVDVALENWCRILKPGGHLFFAVPDFDLYEKKLWPSRFNHDHKSTFSMTRTREEIGRGTHYNIRADIVPVLKKHGVTVLEVRLEDDKYDRTLPDTVDQTAYPHHAQAQIVVVGRKKKGRK